MADRLKLISMHTNKSLLHYCVEIHDYKFSTSLWCKGIDFNQLARHYGQANIDRVCFHIVAFELNKFLSLAPQYIDFGPYKHHCTASFYSLWQTVYENVWAQWRYENHLPDYRGPELTHELSADHYAPIKSHTTNTDLLLFCGGGKDSLVSLRTLDALSIPYSSFVYTHSLYGSRKKQENLLNQLVLQSNANTHHQQSIYDDFLDSPVLDFDPDIAINTLCAAETPSSLFAVIPYLLTFGYHNVALGHERSADYGNGIIDPVTENEINHQWGKSYQAEQLLNQYIGAELFTDFNYFSLLKPLTDVVIFGLLADHPKDVQWAHSCNIDKPWCKRCAKCAYVWLNYQAYLSPDIVDAIFSENLFDLPENEIWFRQMLGLCEHTPFECVGQVDEARLALYLYLQKHSHPLAHQLFNSFSTDIKRIITQETTLDFDKANLPQTLANTLIPYYKKHALKLQNTLLATINH